MNKFIFILSIVFIVILILMFGFSRTESVPIEDIEYIDKGTTNVPKPNYPYGDINDKG